MNRDLLLFATALVIPLAALLGSNGARAQDYQLGANTHCKERTDGWIRNSGSCNSQGQLHGPGAASMGDVLLIGEFVNGLPTGPQHVFYANHTASWRIEAMGAVYERALRGINTANEPPYSRYGQGCVINFLDGQPADNRIACAGIVATARKGKVRMTAVKGRVSFSTDEADISGKGYRVFAPMLAIPGNYPPYTIEGAARQVSLGALPAEPFTNHLFREHFKLSDIDGTFSSEGEARDKRSAAPGLQSLSGRFDFVMGGGQAQVRINTINDDGSPATPVSPEFVYRFKTYYGNFSAALYGRELTNKSAYAYYLKMDEGLEFNASGYELCLKRIWSNFERAFGVAKIEYQNTADAPWPKENHLSFVPRCGKVTDKSGRSYAGFFDEKGRPQPN